MTNTAWLSGAFDDFRRGFERSALWVSMAMEDQREAYAYSYIGAAWSALSFMALAGSIILVFGFGSGGAGQQHYVTYIVTGLLAWGFISGAINEAATVFTSNEPFVRGSTLPLSLYAYRAVARVSITNFYAALGAVVMLLWIDPTPSLSWLLAIPAIIFYQFTALAVIIVLGILCTYARDVRPIIDNVMRAAFFLTPIFWLPVKDSHTAIIAAANPITHYIAIFRDPLTVGTVPWESWAVCAGLTLAFWVLAILTMATFRRRIVFWL